MILEQELLQLHKIAILGGTFNPVHKGHICMVESVLENYPEIDRMIVMPNHMPAYKDQTGIVSDDNRIAMLELATENMSKVSVSDLEIVRGGYTYTIDTLRYLKDLNKDLEIYFVIGDDSLYTFHKWYEYQEVLKLCTLLVAVRHEKHDTVSLYAEDLMNKYTKAKIEILPMEECPVSSSEIRERCKNRQSIDDLVCKKVKEYIEDSRLYV